MPGKHMTAGTGRLPDVGLLKLNIAIRADASLKIGTGHVMRCLALAKALRALRHHVFFITNAEQGHLASLIEEHGFCVRLIKVAHGDDAVRGTCDGECGSLWRDDLAQTEQAIRQEGAIDWLVLDHYRLGQGWRSGIRNEVGRLMVIDDRPVGDMKFDMLLNPNLGSAVSDGVSLDRGQRSTVLAGPRYALLQPEFAELRADFSGPSERVKRICICFGGIDLSNETRKAIHAVRDVAPNDTVIDVIVGQGNPHKESIAQECRKLHNATFNCHSRSIAHLMAKADLAIGAGGSMALERCCLGLPSIVIAVADNQVPGARQLAEIGSILYLGTHDIVTPEQLSRAIAVAVNCPEFLQHMSGVAFKLVDGRGARRVARVMTRSRVTLRPAVANDCERVFSWRNTERVRLASFDTRPIDFADHLYWYHETLQRDDRILLIGEAAGVPIGVLRYDIAGANAMVSIYLGPERSGRGLGPALLSEGCHWLSHNRPQVTHVDAEVRSSNRESMTAFVEAGFTQIGTVFRAAIVAEQ